LKLVVRVSRRRHSVGVSYSAGGSDRDVSRGGMGEWIMKMNHDKRRGSCFVTHLMGLPFPGSPLVFLLPPLLRRATMRCPHPFGEGGAGAAAIRLAFPGALVLEPIPQTRGGAHGQFVVQGWVGFEVSRMKVVVEERWRVNQHQSFACWVHHRSSLSSLSSPLACRSWFIFTVISFSSLWLVSICCGWS